MFTMLKMKGVVMVVQRVGPFVRDGYEVVVVEVRRL